MENLFDKLLVSSDTKCIPNKEKVLFSSFFFVCLGFFCGFYFLILFYFSFYYMTAVQHSGGFNGKILKKQDNLKNIPFSS